MLHLKIGGSDHGFLYADTRNVMAQRILFVGGGSVGHIAPSLAVWHAMKRLEPSAEAHFVCADRTDDREFLYQNSVEFTSLAAPRLSLRFPFAFLPAYRHAVRIIASFAPNVIFSKGGYVSIPVCLAARRRGIPIVLHESDVVSGRANRIVARWAHHICLGFPLETVGRCSGNVTYTGNPIREEVRSGGNREEGLRLCGFNGTRPVLLVMGGSQGSQVLNEAVIGLQAELLQHCDIIHITGRGKVCAPARPGYWSTPFAQEVLPHLYAAADIALSRAGASVLGELAANGIPAILVPLRGVGHDHQQQNARIVEEAGGCVLLQQCDLETALLPVLRILAHDASARSRFAESMSRFYVPDADERIAHVVQKFLA